MEEPAGKLIIFTAPSGAGKTTIVRHLLDKFAQLAFSVSATSRKKRPREQEGVDYYFLSPEAFQQAIAEEAFAEWEEVYAGQYYGTLKREIERLWMQGKHILFDIDVQGALNLKTLYGDQALTIFVQPPNLQALETRLRDRKTEDEASFQKRIRKAKEEMAYAERCDQILVNDDLADALNQAEQIVLSFI